MAHILNLMSECRDYIWGGNRLREEFGKVSDKDIIAESWELAAREDASCRIMNGSYKGRTLLDYINEQGTDVLGTKCKKYGQLPVIVKLIDARNDLSIQVHPSDEYAYKNEGEAGKTEVWYVVDCEPGSQLVYGFREKITKQEFADSIADNSFIEKLNFVTVRKGDVFFIPSGTLHAIGAGILIAEIQQNSDLTYRVYDYNRKDRNGRTRQLHIEKALDVTNLDVSPPQPEYSQQFFQNKLVKKICSCEYFSAEKITVLSGRTQFFADETSFCHLLVTEGSGRLSGNFADGDFELKKGSSIFIPAGYGKYIISGNAEIILTSIK